MISWWGACWVQRAAALSACIQGWCATLPISRAVTRITVFRLPEAKGQQSVRLPGGLSRPWQHMTQAKSSWPANRPHICIRSIRPVADYSLSMPYCPAARFLQPERLQGSQRQPGRQLPRRLRWSLYFCPRCHHHWCWCRCRCWCWCWCWRWCQC
jgi:hypothetical protein